MRDIGQEIKLRCIITLNEPYKWNRIVRQGQGNAIPNQAKLTHNDEINDSDL